MTTKTQRMAFIPELGSVLALENDWECSIFKERRNERLYKADGRGSVAYTSNSKSFYDRTFPAGSVFVIRRIYVRSGSEEYSSVTLAIVNTTDKNLSKLKKGKKPYCRFWVKLEDFNNAKFLVKQDKTISKVPTNHKGAPITLGKYRSRKWPNHYVEFIHPDPEMCFSGERSCARTMPMQFSPVRRPDLVALGWKEEKMKGNGGFFQPIKSNYYNYTPNKFFATCIPNDWAENHKKEKFKVIKTRNWLGQEGEFEFYVHPLDNQIFIPIEKSDLAKLGLKNDIDKLIDIPVAGGKLSFYDIDVK